MPVSEISLVGGLNSDDSLLDIQPGQCLQLHNYEVNTLGKYGRVVGFERVDGRPAPSDELYYSVYVQDTAGITAGTTVTIDGAFTGYVIGVDATEGAIGLVDLEGQVEAGMTLGSTTTTSQQLGRGHPDFETDKAWQLTAEARRRDAIQAVPGSGPIRGIGYFNDRIYAFRDDEAGATCRIWESSADGWVEFAAVNSPAGVPETLNPGGRYEFEISRFPATSDELLMVCCGGTDKALWFDGTEFTKIDDGFTEVYPTHLDVLPSRILALGYPNGSLMYSALNDCSDFDAANGAAEIAIGEPVVGIVTQPNESHVVFQRDAVHVIYGTNPSDFRKTVLSSKAGALEHTIQNIIEPMFVSEQGLALLSRVQQFGDFQQANVTQRVERLMAAQKKIISCAYTVREKNQYRLCYTDGSGLIATFDNGQIVGFSTFDVGSRVPRVAYSCKQSDGKERVFWGGDDGYVYEAERGNSYDGDEYTSVFRPAFNYAKGPERRKRFKKVMVEIRTQGLSGMRLAPELDYDGTETPRHQTEDRNVVGPGGYWGEGIWGEFVWSAPTVLQVNFYLMAVARNISPTFFSTSGFESPHTLNSMLLEFEYRGRRR